MSEHAPSIELTSQVVHALTTLQPVSHSRRGVHLMMVSPLDRWTETIDGDRLADHLGFTWPTFPVFTERGYRTSYRSPEGAAVFEHPVPSTSQPPPVPAGPHAETHTVLAVHTAPGTDPGEVSLSDAGSIGVGWMRLRYGLRLLHQVDVKEDVEARARPDIARVAFRDGTSIWVSWEAASQTRMGWRCTPSDATFDVELLLPLPPVQAVRALAATPGFPLQLR